MAVISEQTFVSDGSTKQFQVVGTILSDSHIGVWLRDVITDVETRLPTGSYDVLGSFVLLNDSVTAGNEVKLILSDNGEDLDVPPSDISNVAGSLENVNIVANNTTNINIVATNMNNVNNVGSNINNVNIVASDTTEINTLASIAVELLSLYNDRNKLTSLFNDKTTLDSIFADKAQIDALFSYKTAIDSFASTYKISSTAPTSPTEGMLWYDTVNNVVKYYNGSGWVAVSPDLAGIDDYLGSLITGVLI